MWIGTGGASRFRIRSPDSRLFAMLPGKYTPQQQEGKGEEAVKKRDQAANKHARCNESCCRADGSNFICCPGTCPVTARQLKPPFLFKRLQKAGRFSFAPYLMARPRVVMCDFFPFSYMFPFYFVHTTEQNDVHCVEPEKQKSCASSAAISGEKRRGRHLDRYLLLVVHNNIEDRLAAQQAPRVHTHQASPWRYCGSSHPKSRTP